MKKHQEALEIIRRDLEVHNLVNSDVERAFDILKAQLAEISDTKTAVRDSLPAPLELKNFNEGLALFTDGACRGNPGPGSWACVAQNSDGIIQFESVGYETLTTNNKMEIQAVIGAFYQLEQHLLSHPFVRPKPVLLFTDSKYVVNGLNLWVPGWKARGWKKADGKKPENLELWEELDFLKLKFPELKVDWVKGHNGHPQNEYCDRLANRLLDAEGF